MRLVRGSGPATRLSRFSSPRAAIVATPNRQRQNVSRIKLCAAAIVSSQRPATNSRRNERFRRTLAEGMMRSMQYFSDSSQHFFSFSWRSLACHFSAEALPSRRPRRILGRGRNSPQCPSSAPDGSASSPQPTAPSRRDSPRRTCTLPCSFCNRT